MNIRKEIKGFREEYRFLSNFYPCKITYDGLIFSSVEAAFQSAKCVDQTERLQFQYFDPTEAKKSGKRVKLRSDWEQVKLLVLKDLIRLKFMGNPELLAKLLATGDALLVESNTWHDNFYGDCTCERCRKITGENHLGLMLMELRDGLLAGGSK